MRDNIALALQHLTEMFPLALLCAKLALSKCADATSQPNIVLIVADDLGWNDVGFHGLNNIPTPNIDALSGSGLTLQNYYVSPLCTPSRSALMTGKHPIHNGMQHGVIIHTEPRGLPLTEKLLPQYLKELGYKTHLIGKWHLGFYKKDYFPMSRGFDSHLGFMSTQIDMYDHTSQIADVWGHDFRRDFDVAFDLYGQYATDIYTDEAVKIIKAHNASTPLFLEICHSAMHAGNPHESLRAPDYLIQQFEHIEDYQRRKYAAMLTKLDESVGKVISTLGTFDNGKWDSWFNPSGREGMYDVEPMFSGLAGQTIAKLELMTTTEKFMEIRKSATVKCNIIDPIECKPQEAPCLFNIEDDPCELRNLAAYREDILNRLLTELSVLGSSAVPPGNTEPVERADPKHWGGVYTNFDDLSVETSCTTPA